MGKASAAQHIRNLIRRRDRLAERIGTRPGPDDWDRGEHAALEWALPILKERSPAFGGEATGTTLARFRTALEEIARCDCHAAETARAALEIPVERPDPTIVTDGRGRRLRVGR